MTTADVDETETTQGSDETVTTDEGEDTLTTQGHGSDGYSYGEANALECGSPDMPIETEEDCRAAAEELGAVFAGVGSWPVPKGCFADLTDGGKIWLNTREVGSAKDTRRPVCAGSGSDMVSHEPTATEDVVEETTEFSEGNTYYYESVNLAECPNGHGIDSAEECEMAAEALGASWVKEGSYTIPRGCVGEDFDGGRVWFNNIPEGEGVSRDHRRPICIQ